MADIAHQEGNNFYKRGDLESAEEAYAMAAKLDGSDPKYMSNLSAVYYEQGRYIQCLEAIYNSWRALRERNHVNGTPATPPLTDALAVKLTLRFMKTKLNGLAVRLFSLHDRKTKKRTPESNYGIENDIEGFLERLVGDEQGEGAKYPEVGRVWKVWREMKQDCAGHTSEECRVNVAEAQRRLRDLPIFKSTLDPVVEYYRFGHDPIRSLFYGIDGTQKTEFHITQEDFINKRWKSAAFLFGGCGDSRHAFATLIHFADICKQLVRERGVKSGNIPKLHMTLVDIHPASLARVMLVFALISKISVAPNRDRRMEITAAAFYAWTTILMPQWCATIICDASKEIIAELTGKTRMAVTKSLAIDDVSKARLLPIFEYWSKPLPKSTKQFVDLNGSSDADDAFSSDFLSAAGIATAASQIKKRSLASNEKFQNQLEQLRKTGQVEYKDKEYPVFNNCQAEVKLYEDARILLPPKQFIERHPALAKSAKAEGKQGRAEVRQEILKDWVPNATLFDNWTTEHPSFSAPGGMPMISSANNPFEFIEDCLLWIIPFREDGELIVDETSFIVMQQFLETVRQAMHLVGESLTIEFCCAELYGGLPKLLAGDFGPRPKTFPEKYLRMWLSNTPDYTGSVLANIIYLAPYLNDSKQAMLLWNCLLNPIYFTNLKSACYHYSNLSPNEIRRFLNIHVRDPDTRKPLDEFNFSTTTRDKLFSSTVSKKELHQYLSTLLLRILCSPKTPIAPVRLDEPINLVTFFSLLVYLCQIAGCPSHWVGDFVQGLVNDTFVTDIVPFTGTLPVTEHSKPRPTLHSRKVNLKPWQVELENILVSAKGALPFSVVLPESYSKSSGAIKTYTARIRSTAERLLTPHHARTACLMFYCSTGQADGVVRSVPARMVDVLEKNKELAGVEVQFLTSPEIVDVMEGYVRWRMSEGWYVKMKEEGWKVVVYITNQARVVADAVEASQWREDAQVDGEGLFLGIAGLVLGLN